MTPVSDICRCQISCPPTDPLAKDTIRYRLGLAAPVLLLFVCMALLVFARAAPPAYPPKISQDAGGTLRPAPPKIEPLVLKPVDQADARAINAKIPFAPGPHPPARAFVFAGDDLARARAADCLTAAMLYEAGHDPAGQRAVAQVVINRARHPAFPKSICGVVFQGAERQSGCQFTFTCDGAMARRYSADAWAAARLLASAALSGNVYAPVGHATHYHTDWVVPYWSERLDKITAVGTHLFFRWPGSWGRPAAFRRWVAGGEPVIAKMAALSLFHQSGTIAENITPDVARDALADGTAFRPAKREISGDTGARLLLDKSSRAEEYLALAEAKCAGKSYCKILGWLDDNNIPEIGEIGDAARRSMAFSFLRDEKNGFEKALWNCAIYPRADKRQCMKR